MNTLMILAAAAALTAQTSRPRDSASAGGFFREVRGDWSEKGDRPGYVFAEIGRDAGAFDLWNLKSKRFGMINEWAGVKPGKATIPFVGPWLKEQPADAAKVVFDVNTRQKTQDIRDFRFVGTQEIDAVYFAAKRADGTRLGPGETVKTGDRLAIRMHVASAPEELALTFYTVNRSPNWAKKGRWELLEIAGAPLILQPTKSDPLLWGAVFTVPKLPKPLKLTDHSLVASINYTGADSRQYGICYGYAQYAFEFEGGAEGGGAANYRFYDFGPAEGPVQTGAQRVTPQDTPKDFKWIKKPGEYYAAPCRQLDASMVDWVEAAHRHPLAMRIKLPPGRTYRVAAGICAIGSRCYHNGYFMPYQGTLAANGKTLWRRTVEEGRDDCYRFMDRDAREEEDLYETYVRPFMLDVGGDVEVGTNGLLDVSLTLFPKPKEGGVIATPLNYLVIYPKDDAACARAYARQLANRRVRFTEFWREDSGGNWDLADPLMAKEEDLGSGPLRLFARANPGNWVIPKMRPYVHEIGQPLVLAAAPGMKFSGTFMINPTRDAKDVTVTLEGDFPAGANPRVWRQMHYRFAHAYGHFLRFGSSHYLPMKPRLCEAKKSYGYALRFDLPADAKPGLYRGTLVARDAEGAEARLPVELTVLDVRLPELDDHRIAMLGPYIGSEYGLRTSREELGCTTATKMYYTAKHSIANWALDEKGNCTKTPVSPESLDAFFKLYNRLGFPCREPFISVTGQGYVDPEPCGRYMPFTPEWRTCVKKMYGDIYAAALSNGLQNAVIDSGGEMGYECKQPKQKTMDDAIRYFKAVHELVPGLKMSYRCNCWSTVTNFFPVLDVAGVRGGASWDMCDAMPMEGAKKDYYAYSVPGRFANGLLGWSHGARGSFREWLSWSHACNYNDFLCQGDCGGSWHLTMMPGPDGTLVPSLHSEGFRASVDDRKFLKLFDQSIAAAKDGPEKENAVAFRELLKKMVSEKIWDTLQPYSYTIQGRVDGNYPWVGVNYDLMRLVICRFVKALESGRASGLPRFRTFPGKPFQFGLEDGPLVRQGLKATNLEFNMKPAKGEKPKTAVATLKAEDGRVIRTVPLGTNATGRRIPFAVGDLAPGVYLLSLTLDGAPAAENGFYVL